MKKLSIEGKTKANIIESLIKFTSQKILYILFKIIILIYLLLLILFLIYFNYNI